MSKHTSSPESLSMFRNAVAEAASKVIQQITPDYSEAERLEVQADELKDKGHDKAADAVRKSADTTRYLIDAKIERQRVEALRDLLPECKAAFVILGLPTRRPKRSLAEACEVGMARADVNSGA